jgi:hypothetical protein
LTWFKFCIYRGEPVDTPTKTLQEGEEEEALHAWESFKMDTTSGLKTLRK